MSQIRSYRDLDVWQTGMDLAERVYRLTRRFPKEEQYRITSQLVRAATSIPANIAEGHMRSTRKDYRNFVSIARGSLAETETYLVLAQRLALAPAEEIASILQLAESLGRRLTRLKESLANTETGAQFAAPTPKTQPPAPKTQHPTPKTQHPTPP